MPSVSLSSIIKLLDLHKCTYVILNENQKEISYINNPTDASIHDLIFIGEERKDAENIVVNTKSELIISSLQFSEVFASKKFLNKTFILLENPRYFFALIFNNFFANTVTGYISPSAIVHSNSQIGSNTLISDLVVIEENCIIGNNCTIETGVVIKKNTIIGNHVKIYPGAVIGSDGFGFIKYKDQIINFPHISGVIIKDYVDIGANTVIDRGALTNTFIDSGTKIDNLCHIAHNVQIGKNCYIIANSMIGGSTKILDNTWIAPSATLRDGLLIGKNVIVGIGANVTKSIPENEVWIGNPAKKIK